MNGKPANPGRRRMLETVGVATAAGLVAPLALGLSRSQSLPCPLARPVDRRYFGMHMHGIAVRRPWVPYGDRLTAWPEIDFGTWRLWDAYVAWPNLQPHRDRWDFSVLDHYVDLAAEHDVEIVLPLGLTPSWASARPDEKSSYKPGNAAEPANIEDWRNYVHKVAERYKGKIRYYEFWNEPNVPPGEQGAFFSGSVGKAVELAREAYRILKSVDPANRFAAPAAVGSGRHLAWLDRFLELGGKDALDILSYHFYVAESDPESMVPLIGKVREIAGRHGLGNVPIWNTESGWWMENKEALDSDVGVVKGWRKLGQEKAAAYVARVLILGWAAGVERFCWYAWDHTNMGLIEPSDKMLRPAGRAYATVASWMTGAVVSKCTVEGNVWLCELIDATGKPVRIVWLREGSKQMWHLPDGCGATQIETLDGKGEKLPTGVNTIQLGQAPVRLT